jgi:hypothetical protein
MQWDYSLDDDDDSSLGDKHDEESRRRVRTQWGKEHALEDFEEPFDPFDYYEGSSEPEIEVSDYNQEDESEDEDSTVVADM